MSTRQRLEFYLWHALHSYTAVWQLLLTGSERATAARDAARVCERLPFLAGYQERAVAVREELRPVHRDYVATVSPDLITISLELAVFLSLVCRAVRPRAILDLGSGFSSYVFRAYAGQSGTEPTPLVCSVDESARWLDETRRFLRRHHLDSESLVTADELAASPRGPFDLVLHDIGDFATRLRMMDLVLAACRPGGLVLIDDMHVPSYRRQVRRELDRRGLAHFSLRAFTRQRLRYSYLVLR